MRLTKWSSVFFSSLCLVAVMLLLNALPFFGTSSAREIASAVVFWAAGCAVGWDDGARSVRS